MKNKTAMPSSAAISQPLLLWRGLGLWNLYFIAKFGLYWTGFINFHVFYNLVFAAGLLLPLRPLWLHRLRHLAAIPVGVALLYYDSWLPPFRRLLEQPEVLQFSNDYLLELLSRFINWEMVGAGLVLLVAYLFLAQWFRMTLFTVLALIWVSLANVQIPGMPSLHWGHETPVVAVSTAASAVEGTAVSVPVQDKSINEILNEELANFYQTEQARQVQFSPAAAAEATPFDLLFLNICSLSWSDLEVTQLLEHPLFKKMDMVFDDFNSATSYSGPAVSRLMQANCGQLSHAALYEESPKQCSLFSNLKELGFDTRAALNHDGKFQGFIDEILSEEAFSEALVPTELNPVLRGFDGAPIWDDYDTLNLWLNQQKQSQSAKPSALLYNTITLHDGNREATEGGGGRTSPYQKRAQKLLDELDSFMNQLERSGRQVAVLFIPEHGAALKGDRMQISGMREIPTPDITHVPVGVRLIGAKAAAPESPVHVTKPTSFLAVAELVSQLINTNAFEQPVLNWEGLAADLAQTRLVSENEGTVMMEYKGEPYVRLNGKNWIKYQP